jgi:hypothetical protein
VRRRRLVDARLLTAALAAAALPGCTGVEAHLFDTSHPWHAYPAAGTALIVTAPFLPLAFAESAVTGNEPGMHSGNAFSTVGGLLGVTAGIVVGGAAYVVGLPLEFVLPVGPEEDATPGEDERRVPSVPVPVPAPPPAPGTPMRGL